MNEYIELELFLNAKRLRIFYQNINQINHARRIAESDADERNIKKKYDKNVGFVHLEKNTSR